MKSSKEKVSFDADAETLQALKVVIRTLGRGNKSEGIRRALIQTAQHINQENVRNASVKASETVSLTPAGEAAGE